MSSPFDFINTVNNKTEKIEMDAVGQKDYVPFIINRGLSNNMQTVLFANEMNRFSFIPKTWQYDFYYHGVPKGRRFDKWAKKTNDEDIDAIRKFYHINRVRAEEYLQLLSKEQVDLIKQKLKTGGKNG